MATKRAKASQDEVDKAVREIRTCWEAGQQSLRDLPGRGGYRDKAVKEAAGRLGWNETKLRKCRRIADPDAGYTRPRLDELMRLIREHKPVFAFSHLAILATVPWDARPRHRCRAAVQMRCIKENWSRAELEDRIKSLFGPRRRGGRRRRVPDDPALAVVQLAEMSDTWQRWCRIADPDGKDGGVEGVLARMAEGVRKRVRRIDAEMRRLREDLEVVAVHGD